MARLKHVYTPTQEEKYQQGNKVIEAYMGGYNIDIFSDKNADKLIRYNDSWDLLMKVIRKIKSKVFNEGYDMFMPEHYAYISIGNACYDADLLAAWQAVVKWITLNFDLKDFAFAELNIGDIAIKKGMVYKTKDNKDRVYFKINPKVIRRYKQLFDYNGKVDDICKKLSTKYLYDAYVSGGDGRYFIGDRLIAVIENYKIITVLKCEIGVIYNKYSRIDYKIIYN